LINRALALTQSFIAAGKALLRYDDDSWNDDRVEWSVDRKQLTLREVTNASNWTLVFLKQFGRHHVNVSHWRAANAN
jgi:hypothetical protein